MAVNNIRRNPFWAVICEELPKHGYEMFDSDYQNSDYKVIIQGKNQDGAHTTQEFIFARVCRQMRSVHNFRADLRRFLRIDLPNRQFYPRDHHTRQPGQYIQKINHDVPKKQLTTPLPMLREAAQSKLPDIQVYPWIPDSFTTDRIVQKPKDVGPLSNTKSLAAFLVDNADLPALLELMNGLAMLRGVKPAPIKITGEKQEPSVIAQQQPSVQPVPQPPKISVVPQPVPEPKNNVVRLKLSAVNQPPLRKKHAPGLADAILNMIVSNPSRSFGSADLLNISDNRDSINATLANLVAMNKIKRVARGVYQAKQLRKKNG